MLLLLLLRHATTTLGSMLLPARGGRQLLRGSHACSSRSHCVGSPPVTPAAAATPPWCSCSSWSIHAVPPHATATTTTAAAATAATAATAAAGAAVATKAGARA